ncbi:MAG TPA: DUF998 domain-containing protein [Methanomicrobiales archaeon]|nr:DUF998 domain-containing protein [Methanomicrobiales archaeon]
MAESLIISLRSQNVAGVLLVTLSVISLMGIITAETLYPGYSISQNAISDLGATGPPGSVVQPSATIFNTAMVVSGVLVIGAAYFIHRAFKNRPFTALLALTGIGILGVGIFPENYGAIHVVLSAILFTAGSLSAIVSYTVEAPLALRYYSVALGAVSLIDLSLLVALDGSSPFALLGFGGLERWIVYPILLWGTVFGGYLLGRSHPYVMRP